MAHRRPNQRIKKFLKRWMPILTLLDEATDKIDRIVKRTANIFLAIVWFVVSVVGVLISLMR